VFFQGPLMTVSLGGTLCYSGDWSSRVFLLRAGILTRPSWIIYTWRIYPKR
jgi:hypothetical protein